MEETTIRIQGMSCQHCAASIQEALEALAGLSVVEVSLERGEARFLKPESLPMDRIRAAVEEAGYRVVG